VADMNAKGLPGVEMLATARKLIADHAAAQR